MLSHTAQLDDWQWAWEPDVGQLTSTKVFCDSGFNRSRTLVPGSIASAYLTAISDVYGPKTSTNSASSISTSRTQAVGQVFQLYPFLTAFVPSFRHPQDLTCLKELVPLPLSEHTTGKVVPSRARHRRALSMGWEEGSLAKLNLERTDGSETRIGDMFCSKLRMSFTVAPHFASPPSSEPVECKMSARVMQCLHSSSVSKPWICVDADRIHRLCLIFVC